MHRVTIFKCAGCTGSIIVVVTPLIALMMDQKQSLQKKGLNVEFVEEAQNDEKVTGAVLGGEVQMVFISPESLLNNKKIQSMLLRDVYQERMVALIVDETHCVQMW